MTPEVRSSTILHLSTSSGPGGAERVISTMAAAMNQSGWRVIVGMFRTGWLQEECDRLGVKTMVIPLTGIGGVGWIRDCRRFIRRERVDLVHAHEFSAIVLGWIVAMLVGIPFVATVHGKNYYWEKRRRRIAYRVISRFGTMVAVSENLKEFLCQKVGIADTRVRVIYNGVDAVQKLSEEEIDSCKSELGVVGCYPILGVVGSLYEVKGHKYLLDALPDVVKQWPKSVLLIIGRGDLEAPLKNQADEQKISAHVRFLGMRHDVPRLLSVMDAFVLPSLSEGLSMALLEAMDAGKPVVATRVGGNPELTVHGRTGFLVEPKDVKSLATHILRLIDDPVAMKSFGQEGAERTRLMFSRKLMAGLYGELYERLLDRRQGVGRTACQS